MLKKMAAWRLQPGMYVADSGLSWTEHPYLYAKVGVVASKDEVQAIVQEGFTDVFVDTERGSYVFEDAPAEMDLGAAADLAPEAHEHLKPLQQEYAAAKKIYAESVTFARRFMEDARATQQVDIGQGEAFVEEIIGSVTRNPDALISLSKLRTYDEYTFTHCINVAVLTLGFAEFFGIHRTELRALGIAALFHDIGKARIPNAVLNKPGRLSDEEFAVMRRHPLLSYQLLRDNEHGGSSLDPDVLHGIVEHHEKHNGKGYPRGLKDDAIHIYGRVIALADVYDALTSARVYKPAMPPTKALQIMFEMRDKDFRATDVSMFIKFLGIYPVGSLVRLSDGHHGVVSEANREDVRRPRVLVAFDRDLAPAPRQVVDLAEHTDLAIAEGLDHREHGIDPMALLAA